jgi:hypothetical protein
MDDAARRGDGRKARNGVAGKFAGFGNGPGGAHGVAGSCGLRGAAVGLARRVTQQSAACGLADVRPVRSVADALAGRFIGGKPGADAVTLGSGFDVPREAGRMLRFSRQSAMALAFLRGAPDKESPRASAMRSSAAKPHGGEPGTNAVARWRIVAGAGWRIAAGLARSFRNPARSAWRRGRERMA